MSSKQFKKRQVTRVEIDPRFRSDREILETLIGLNGVFQDMKDNGYDNEGIDFMGQFIDVLRWVIGDPGAECNVAVAQSMRMAREKGYVHNLFGEDKN